jgi:hypothetical protein
MDEQQQAAQTIRQTLTKVKQFLAQETPHRLQRISRLLILMAPPGQAA